MSGFKRRHATPTSELRAEFWNAPDDALLSRKITAAGIGRSETWMKQAAIRGEGIPYLKIGRSCLYRKSEALAWLKLNARYVQTSGGAGTGEDM